VDLATAQTRLASVTAAIAAAEKAQSYSGNGRSKTMANLETLYKRQDTLQQLVDRLSGESSFATRGVVSGLGECS
jgi:hypothetical protein